MAQTSRVDGSLCYTAGQRGRSAFFLQGCYPMKWPQWPGRSRAHPSHPSATLPAQAARRGLVMLMLLLGLVVWVGPHLVHPRWQPWGEPAHRWAVAQTTWAAAARSMTDQEQQALNDARTVQARIDACTALTAVRCLQNVPAPQSALGQLVLVQAWRKAIDAESPSSPVLVHQGLHALDRLQVLGDQDLQRWTGLTQVFQQTVNVCARTWPEILCGWWAASDEQTWGLTWDRVNNVVLPPDDAQVVPDFVREHRRVWSDLLQPVRSTKPLPQALSSQDPRDDPRDIARSDGGRKRPDRSSRVD